MDAGGFAPWASQPLPVAEAVYTNFSRALGCGAEDLACMRAANATDIVRAACTQGLLPAEYATRHNPWAPVVDGVELSAEVWQLAQRGKRAAVPLMLGSNRDEMSATYFDVAPKSLSKAGLAGMVADLIPLPPTTNPAVRQAAVEELLSLYDPRRFPVTECCTPYYWAAMRIASDWGFTCPNRRAARWLAPAVPSDPTSTSSSVAVYQFLFNHLTDQGMPPTPFQFVPHASQRAYVFRDLNLLSAMDTGPEHHALQLSAMLGQFWTNMARHGAPNLAVVEAKLDGRGNKMALPLWPQYHNATDALVLLDGPANATTVGGFRREQCDFMDRMLLL